MAWDHDADVLYWASWLQHLLFPNLPYLWTMDTATVARRPREYHLCRESETMNPAAVSVVPLPTPGSTVCGIVPAQKPLGATVTAAVSTLPVRNEAPAGLHHRTDCRGQRPVGLRTSPSPVQQQ